MCQPDASCPWTSCVLHIYFSVSLACFLLWLYRYMTGSRHSNIRSRAVYEKQSSSVACQTSPGGQLCAHPASPGGQLFGESANTGGNDRERNVHEHKMQQGAGNAGNSLYFVDSAPRKTQSYLSPVRQNSEHYLPGHENLVYRRLQASCDNKHSPVGALLMPCGPKCAEHLGQNSKWSRNSSYGRACCYSSIGRGDENNTDAGYCRRPSLVSSLTGVANADHCRQSSCPWPNRQHQSTAVADYKEEDDLDLQPSVYSSSANLWASSRLKSLPEVSNRKDWPLSVVPRLYVDKVSHCCLDKHKAAPQTATLHNYNKGEESNDDASCLGPRRPPCPVCLCSAQPPASTSSVPCVEVRLESGVVVSCIKTCSP